MKISKHLRVFSAPPRLGVEFTLALLLLAGSAFAQTPTAPATPAPANPAPPATPEAPGTSKPGVPARRGGLPPAPKPTPPRPVTTPNYKELKYPPLHPIQIPKVDQFQLPNGMKVYLMEDHELPTISGVALVRTGNLFDPADKIGLATMTGMVMRTGGTKAKTGDELDQQLEDIAASVETGIDESSGSVSFSALKENTDEVLGIFHDVLTGPEFREDKIELARTQLRSAISRRNDDAHGIAQREFRDIILGKTTPYGWEMQYATVDAITRADIQNFYQRYFFPANIMLAVRGDFDTAAMKSKLQSLFAGWTVQQPPVPPFPKVADHAEAAVYLAEKKDVAQTFFAIGEIGGEFREKDYPALEIMADILGGGFQSRLFQRVRTRMGNAYAISANWAADYNHPGLFEIAGSTKSVSTVETIRAIQEEVDRIRSSEVTDEELKTAKDTALNSLVFAFDTKAKTLSRILTYEYYGYPKDFIQQYQKGLEAVTRADVLRVAKEHLAPQKFIIVAAANPPDFGPRGLQTLGLVVKPIDLSIPQPKQAAAKSNPGTMEKGREILLRAQRAAGGADRLSAVKDFVSTATFHVAAAAGGLNVKETDRWISPTSFRQESVVPSGRIIAYSDGKTGWISTPQGSGTLAGAQLEQVQSDLFRIYYRLLLSDRIPGRIVNGIEANAIEITNAEGQTARLYLDPATGLPAKVTYAAEHVAGPPMSVEEDYSDFRDVAGVKVPFKITILQGGRKFADVEVDDYKVNTGLKPEDLSKRP